METPEEYQRTCFVIMPYGKRRVEGATIDFDDIYANILKPAIQRVRTPEDKQLIARRADEEVHSRNLLHSMVQWLLGSRLALADLTSHNPNVMYELAMRQTLLGSGTVVIRMTGVPVPFDIAYVAAMEYKHHPPADAKASIVAIAKSLRATLRHNELDSPVYEQARKFVRRMGTPGNPTEFGEKVVEAEEAVLKGDVMRADNNYRKAFQLEPSFALIHQRRGSLLLKDHAHEALQAFREAHAAGLPTGLRKGYLQQFVGKIEPSVVAEIVRSTKPLAPDSAESISKLVKRAATKLQDKIQVAVVPLKDSATSAVRVVNPVGLDSTGSVFQVLRGMGNVAHEGKIYFADTGRVAHDFVVKHSETPSSHSLAKDIASNLKAISGGNVTVKVGRSRGGGFDGSGGNFGGSF